MNNVKYKELEKEFGERCVWFDESEKMYYFSMNDELLCVSDEESFRIEDKYVNDKNIEISVGYGDDILNCVGVRILEDMDDDIEEFVLKYVGVNCYSEE